MGISPHGAKFLLFARSAGVDFSELATIGRQGLYATARELRAAFDAYPDAPTDEELRAIGGGASGYADRLFARLGAKLCASFDYSDFEGATVIHDMNEPAPAELHEQYSAVLDSGSLEHVFNFPTAIRNCMEMVKVGGHFLAITPANNFFGHGFYQFSPELFFSVLSPENGFELTTMLAFEETKHAVWYSVRSPQEVRERVTLQNAEPVYLCIIARRIARKPIFRQTPQQSDYLPRWKAETPTAPAANAAPARRPLPIRLAKLVLPFGVRQSIRRAFTRPKPAIRPGFDPRFFRRVGAAPKVS
ncbi:MAG TPA: hypothetical protein VFE13_16245 [Caulobacteraceae bacterium]|nr:hypothetical protein [Caulobacteraceae bacterium]